jgi:phosphatidylethanolamine N-methyltransferase
MYNGDSFGWLFDAPVSGGPYQYFSDPQYVGTTAAAIGSAFYYRATDGFLLALVMGIVFYVSVHYVEGPHMNRIYSNKKKSKLY